MQGRRSPTYKDRAQRKRGPEVTAYDGNWRVTFKGRMEGWRRRLDQRGVKPDYIDFTWNNGE